MAFRLPHTDHILRLPVLTFNDPVPMRAYSSRLLAAAAVAVTTAAAAGCASSGAVAHGNHGRSCTPETVDSAYAALGVVYRNCDVDMEAAAITTPIPSDLGSQSSLACMSATVQFVVDEHGRVLSTGAKVVRANLTAFGRTVLDALPEWTYRPAIKDGAPVRQLVEFKETVLTRTTVSSSRGSSTRSGSTTAPQDC